MKFFRVFTASLPVMAFIVTLGCASRPPLQESVGLAGLPARITVHEWPYWVDIPIESKDFERTWRTVIDVVSERAAIGVLDKESGYVRTEWRPVDIDDQAFPGQGGYGNPGAKGDLGDTYNSNGIQFAVLLAQSGGRRSVKAGDDTTGEQRYTFRVRPAESKIRMGIEARSMPSQRWATGLRNSPNAPWVGIHRELQDRLVVR